MTHILPLVFLVFIVYVGSVAYPSAFSNIWHFLKGEYDFSYTAGQFELEYNSMLDFERINLQNKETYINFNGLMARAMGQRGMNNIVKLDNGHLTPLLQGIDVSVAIRQISKLNEMQAKNGKVFLFVMAPFQVPENEDIIPPGYIDYSNMNADALLEGLAVNGVPVLDLREEMRKDGLNHSNSFFITDNHWKPETGFWAYTSIIEYLSENGMSGPIPDKYIDLESYNIDVRENCFLGNAGKRTGIYYGGLDDFSVITPKYETEIHAEIPSIELDKTGSFDEVMIDWTMLELDYFILPSMHSAYSFGPRGFKSYLNEGAPIDLKLMAIGDSFSNIPFTFTPLVFKENDRLDMRHFKGDFKEYHLEFDPDIVVLLINPSAIHTANAMYDFSGDQGNDAGELPLDAADE